MEHAIIFYSSHFLVLFSFPCAKLAILYFVICQVNCTKKDYLFRLVNVCAQSCSHGDIFNFKGNYVLLKFIRASSTDALK